MAIDKNEQKILRDIQRDITESVKERSAAAQKEANNYNKMIDSMQEAVKLGKVTAGQVMHMSRKIQEIAEVEDNLKEIQDRKKKILFDRLSGMKRELLSGKMRFKQVWSQYGIEDKALTLKQRRIVLEETISDLQEKAKNAFMKQVVQAGLMVSALALMKKLAFSFAERVDTVGKTFGVAGGGIQGALFESSNQMVKLGGGLDQAISMTNVLSSDFGLSAAESAKMANNIFDSSVAMGLSADEGANLFGTLMSIGNMTQMQAENLAESAFQLAAAEGVAPQAVMKDIAGNTELFAKYMKDGGKNVLDAAVQAKKLGLNLSAVEGIAGGLLDFQSSLNAEIEASIMLGRNINLQKARELALENDLTGMMEEVLKQAGGEAEFNKMNRLEREAIAKAIGVSVSDMAKLVGEHGKLETQKSFADIAGKDAISNLTNIINKIKSIGAILLDKVGPVFENTFGKLLNWLETSTGITRMQNFVVNIADTLANLPGIIKGIINIMVIWKSVSLGVAAAQMAAAVGFAGATVPIIGIGMGLAAAAAAWTAISALPSFANLPPGMAATPQMGSAALAHSTGTFGKETIMHTDGIEGRLDTLIGNMESYFGFGGTTSKQMGREFAGKMQNMRDNV